MKKLMLTLLPVILGVCVHAQILINPVTSLALPKGNTNMIYKSILRPVLPNVLYLPLDNMPCLVTIDSASNTIPNPAWPLTNQAMDKIPNPFYTYPPAQPTLQLLPRREK